MSRIEDHLSFAIPSVEFFEDLARPDGQGGSIAFDAMDPAPSPELQAIETERAEMVRGALARLPHRDRMLILERHGEGRTLESIGRDLGLSRERVRQLEAGALALLRMEMLRPGSTTLRAITPTNGTGARVVVVPTTVTRRRLPMRATTTTTTTRNGHRNNGHGGLPIMRIECTLTDGQTVVLHVADIKVTNGDTTARPEPARAKPTTTPERRERAAARDPRKGRAWSAARRAAHEARQTAEANP